MNLIEIVLVVLVVGYILVGRTKGQVLRAKRLLVLPGILTVVGLSSLAQVTTPAAVGFVVAGCVVGIVIGVVRGATVHVFARDGVSWLRYRLSTVLLWIVAIGVRVAMIPLEQALDPTAASLANSAVMLTIGIGILAESIVVLYRAMHLESTLVWATDKAGAHTTRSWLTDLHTRVRSVVE